MREVIALSSFIFYTLSSDTLIYNIMYDLIDIFFIRCKIAIAWNIILENTTVFFLFAYYYRDLYLSLCLSLFLSYEITNRE